MKKPFVTLEQLQEMVKTYPTPFHLYDEKASGKMPVPAPGLCLESRLPGVFRREGRSHPCPAEAAARGGCGCDCSSMTELMISERCGITGENIMFSSNDTPAEEFQMADRLGASSTWTI